MSRADEISVTLPPDMLRAVRESVETGDYPSTDAALRDAVRIWQRERQDHAERLAAIKARIDRSMDDPRPSLTADEVDEVMERFFEQAAKDRGDAAA